MDQECNLNLTLDKKVPAMFHNSQNYDSHLILKEMGKNNFKINFMPKAIEKYMSFTIKQSEEKYIKAGFSLLFTDSVPVFNSSLDNLVINLCKNYS